MKQLVGFIKDGFTKDGAKVTVVDFVLNSNTEETFAICLTSSGHLIQTRIDNLSLIHFEHV